MRDKGLYAAILGITDPWQVVEVDLRTSSEEVRVKIRAKDRWRFCCPQCNKPCPGYDTRSRSWRHLDTCQFKTFLDVDVPRVKCADHGILQIAVPWAEPNSGFTAMMESLIIDWLVEASISAVARRMRLSWKQVDGVMRRAVQRGLARRRIEDIERIGVDEKSFQKRHEYVTIVNDLDGDRVLYVGDDRTAASLDGFYKSLSPEQLAGIKAVALDMCQAYIRSTFEHVEDARSKICFDRFHVARLLNDAVNAVRKQENRELAAEGAYVPKRTKYVWAQNPENMPQDRRAVFELLRHSSLKAAKAWAFKDAARHLWSYAYRGWAAKAWKRWIAWAVRSRLEPIKRAARTIREHLWGIINAVVLSVTNAASEGRNAKIQWIKQQACGFRNRERFRNAIYFHCGRLDLYPGALSTHTKG